MWKILKKKEGGKAGPDFENGERHICKTGHQTGRGNEDNTKRLEE